MRTVTVPLAGQDRVLCFTARVVKNVCEKYGSLDKFFTALRSDDQGEAFGATVWALAEMGAAGERYARSNGIDAAPALTEDGILDLCDLKELTSMGEYIAKAIVGGSEREVEAEPPKNAWATQGHTAVG